MNDVDQIMNLVWELCRAAAETSRMNCDREEDAVIEAINQALSARVPDGWQPIETAPRETEVFIGAHIDGKWKFGRSQMFYEHANEFEGETFSGWVWSIDDCDDSVAEMPTHWMPLPAEPGTGPQPPDQREWVGLTDEDITLPAPALWGHGDRVYTLVEAMKAGLHMDAAGIFSPQQMIELARTIEAKLREKNFGGAA